MGYIDPFGRYHKSQPDVSMLRNSQQRVYKQAEWNQQRKDYAREIIQPHKNGKPNPDFIDAYPVESKEIYNFTPSDEDILKGQ